MYIFFQLIDPDNPTAEPRRIKRNAGIPLSFMTATDNPHAQGALQVGEGRFAVPTIDKWALIHSLLVD